MEENHYQEQIRQKIEKLYIGINKIKAERENLKKEAEKWRKERKQIKRLRN